MIDAREYVSTAYFSMAIFAAILMIILLPVFFLFDWRDFFNSTNISSGELRGTIIVFIYSIITYFVLSLINQVINAVQRNALTSIVPILANVFFISSLLILLPRHNASLLYTSMAYAFSLVAVIIGFSIFFFKEYKYLTPGFSFFKKSKIKSILSLGLKFFVIQITCVIIFSSDNVIVTQLFGPKLVTTYSIPFMIFNNIGMLVNLITMPLYSSYTEAYSKGNLEWIRSKVLLQCKLMIPFICGVAIVVYFFKPLLELWIKTPIDIPVMLPMFMGLYTIVTVWNNIFSFVLGGIGKINLGMYSTIFIGLLNIPLSIYLAKYQGMGLNGIVLSNIICLGISFFISPIQVYYFIFSKNHSDKWDRILS
jgi:O-antigen/teichoic acid export membrane protein